MTPRTAAPKPTTKEASAHPADANFDPGLLAQYIGDTAETIRSMLSKQYDTRPPGLSTRTAPDGVIQVVVDDPLAGLGMVVTISPLRHDQDEHRQPTVSAPPAVNTPPMPAPATPPMPAPAPLPIAPQPILSAAPSQSLPQAQAPQPTAPTFGLGPQV